MYSCSGIIRFSSRLMRESRNGLTPVSKGRNQMFPLSGLAPLLRSFQSLRISTSVTLIYCTNYFFSCLDFFTRQHFKGFQPLDFEDKRFLNSPHQETILKNFNLRSTLGIEDTIMLCGWPHFLLPHYIFYPGSAHCLSPFPTSVSLSTSQPTIYLPPHHLLHIYPHISPISGCC